MLCNRGLGLTLYRIIRGIQLKCDAFVIFVSMAILMTGCSSDLGRSSKLEEKPSSYMHDENGRPVADAVSKFVVNTPPGSAGSVSGLDGRIVHARVGHDYTSALGQRCRTVWISDKTGGTVNNAVCFNGIVWGTVFPW